MKRKNNYLSLLVIVAILLGVLGGIYYNEYLQKTESTYSLEALLDIKDNNYINNKINYFKTHYAVDVKAFSDPNYLNSNYNVELVYNEDDIMNALNELEEYFLLFNKEFFLRFYEYGMNGLNIYFADSIIGLTNGFEKTEVVGLYFKKDKKYNIIIDINATSRVNDIMAHETMHLIEDYLKIKEYDFSKWNKLNPQDFTYLNTYYINKRYDDTMKYNRYNKYVYFIDNYARSNASEDRARIFEAMINDEDFSSYPHLNAKIRFLKELVLTNFPELNYTF